MPAGMQRWRDGRTDIRQINTDKRSGTVRGFWRDKHQGRSEEWLCQAGAPNTAPHIQQWPRADGGRLSNSHIFLFVIGVTFPWKEGAVFIAFPCSPYPDVLQNPRGNASQLPLFTFPVNYGPMIFCSVKAETSEFTGSLVSPYGETPWQMHLAPAALITQGRLSAEPNQASLSGQAESNFFCKKKAEQHPTPGPHLAFFFLLEWS